MENERIIFYVYFLCLYIIACMHARLMGPPKAQNLGQRGSLFGSTYLVGLGVGSNVEGRIVRLEEGVVIGWMEGRNVWAWIVCRIEGREK